MNKQEINDIVCSIAEGCAMHCEDFDNEAFAQALDTYGISITIDEDKYREAKRKEAELFQQRIKDRHIRITYYPLYNGQDNSIE